MLACCVFEKVVYFFECLEVVALFYYHAREVFSGLADLSLYHVHFGGCCLKLVVDQLAYFEYLLLEVFLRPIKELWHCRVGPLILRLGLLHGLISQALR